MEMTQSYLLQKIGEARFACVELQLYLDTHPDDAAAETDFNCYAEKLQRLIALYEQQYGPLMNFGESAMQNGAWVYQKWPWEL